MNSLLSQRRPEQVILALARRLVFIPGHTEGMIDRPTLPSPVREMPVLYKLIWTHLQEVPGEIKIAEFAEQLGLSAAKTGTALNYMVKLGAVIDLGLVVPDVPARGRPVRAYRVATSAELRTARPYQALPERER